jgi:hypothetical protein
MSGSFYLVLIYFSSPPSGGGKYSPAVGCSRGIFIIRFSISFEVDLTKGDLFYGNSNQ